MTNSTNSSNSTAAVHYDPGFSLGALILVAVMATVGGFAFHLINGVTIPRFRSFPGIKTPPLLGKLVIPPLLGMVLMGIIARNFFGVAVEAY